MACSHTRDRAIQSLPYVGSDNLRWALLRGGTARISAAVNLPQAWDALGAFWNSIHWVGSHNGVAPVLTKFPWCLQLDGASPGVVGCSTPAQPSPAPGKTAASMLRVASRDILAPYSPIASKSVRCSLVLSSIAHLSLGGELLDLWKNLLRACHIRCVQWRVSAPSLLDLLIIHHCA